MVQVSELDDRIAKCNKILDENPNSQIFAALAEALRKKGQLDKAFRICQTGLKIHQDYGSAHMVMAKINLDKGLLDWAEIEVQRVVELDGHSHAADLLQAEIYLNRGEFAEATRILSKLKDDGVANPNIKRLLGLAERLQLQAPHQPLTGREAVTEEEVSEQEAAAAEKGISINDFIDRLSSLDGIEGILLVNRDGLVAESAWDNSQPAELFGALARDIERSVQEQIDRINFGSYEHIMIEAGELTIIFMPMQENLLLIKASNKVNLGTLRLRLTSLLERLDIDFD